MPFDVSGNFTRVHDFETDRTNGIKILASRMDAEFDNFATGMNSVFFRSGLVPMTGDIAMGLNGISGLKDGLATNPSIKFGTDANTGIYLSAFNTIGFSTNAVNRASISNTGLTVAGSVTAASEAISGNSTIGGTLGVTGVLTAGSNATVAGTLGVTGIISSGNLHLRNGASVVKGYVGTTDLITGAGVDDLRVRSDGAAIVFGFGGNESLRISSTGSTVQTAGAISAASFTATGAVNSATAAISGNATVGGTLGVTGVLTASSNATVGGTLGVTGALTAASLGLTTPLPVASGGTAGNTAAAARTGLELSSVNNVSFRDVTASRGDGTGAVFFGGALKSITYDLTNFVFGGANISAPGLTLTSALAVTSGGTGVTTSTGTGSVVLSASPTFTGTASFATVGASGTVACAGLNSTGAINSTSASLPIVQLVKTGTSAGTAQLFNDGSVQLVAGAVAQNMNLRADTIILRNQDTSMTFATITAGNFTSSVNLFAPTAAYGTANTQVATTALTDQLRDIPQVGFTGSITPDGTYRGKHAYYTGAGAHVLTVGSGIFGAGHTYTVVNDGGGAITIARGAGVVMRWAATGADADRTLAVGGMATIMCVASNRFFISGAGLT